MNQFNPVHHYVGAWRLCRKPAEGKIIHTEVYQGLELALYQRTEGEPEWRMLEPENPVPVDRIELTRAEGPSHLCGKTKVIRREMRKGTGDPKSIFGEDWSCSAFIVAGSELLMWGMTAPKNGGYDKCDFEIFWQDGSHYEGRFDLQYGGTEDGQGFAESFRYRLRFYAGLGPTPQTFRYKNAVEQYSEEEARQRYLDYVNGENGFAAGAREMLAKLEI